jgi:exosortase K
MIITPTGRLDPHMNRTASHHPFQWIGRAVPFCIVIALAVALKRYYSLAEADGLVWILAPTARCVELVTGIPFSFEQGTGFVNLGHRAVIAPACAGVNFMIIVFCMISFSLLRHGGNGGVRLSVIPAAFLSAYCLTIIVNALRIGLSIFSYDTNIHFGWFTQVRIHRFEGTMIYFVSLCCIYAILMMLIRRTRNSGGDRQNEETLNPASTAWRFMTPAAWYCTVTFAVPLLLGKFSVYGRQLIEHGLFVVALPLAITLFFWLGSYYGRKHKLLLQRRNDDAF